MRTWLIISALLLAACGGGSEPSKTPPRSAEDDLYLELLTACRTAEKQLPGLSDWAGVLDEVTSGNDGRAEFFALAREYSESRPEERPLVTAEDFIDSMNETRARMSAEKDMTPEDLRAALQTSEAFVDRFTKLTRFESLAVLSPREDSSTDRELAVAGLMTEMRRRTRLLVFAGRAAQAERELVAYLRVLQRLDRNGCLRTRVGVNGEVSRILIDLSQGALQPLLVSTAVKSELDQLNEADAAGRKLAWYRELTYSCSYYLAVPKDQLLSHLEDTRRERSEGLKRSTEELKFGAELATEFPDHAPDVLNEADFDRAVEIGREYYHGVIVKLSEFAWAEARLQAAWLGYQLRRAHDHESLRGRTEAIQMLVAKHPGAVARVTAGSIVVAVDPELQAAGWINREELIPVITIRLSDD